MESPPRLALSPIGIWTGALDMVPAAEAQELAAELEQLGYGAIWLPEVAGRDVMVHLALLLSATQRLVGATGIASIWARDAVTMTGGVKGLTEAFPERVLLGLGVSHHTLVEELRGHQYERPLAAMRTYLDAMDKAPYSAFRPTTPVRRVLAALGPKMLALSRGADRRGPHLLGSPGAHRAGQEADGGGAARSAPSRRCCSRATRTRAREIGRAHTGVYVRLPNYQNNLRRLGFSDEDFDEGGSDRVVDAIVAWGDEQAIVDRVRAQFDAGADHVCVQPLPGRPREVPAEQWRALAPALRELAGSVAGRA